MDSKAVHMLARVFITLFLLYLMFIIVDAAFSALFLGNQLLHASLASAGVTILAYFAPFLACVVCLIAVWRIKK